MRLLGESNSTVSVAWIESSSTSLIAQCSSGFTFCLGVGGGYSKFAGRDISRALAKMSFDPDDLKITRVDDLDEKQIKVLQDWISTFEEKKQYPIVGRLDKKKV
jgi:hypothetical protein